MPRDPPVTIATLPLTDVEVMGAYNNLLTMDVAILGAGELGGLVAHALARRDAARLVHLVDDAGRVAEGKALDIAQAAASERFSTELRGSTDPITAAGA